MKYAKFLRTPFFRKTTLAAGSENFNFINQTLNDYLHK